MILKEDFSQLMIGNMVGYYLRGIDLPKNPYRIWHGRILYIDTLKRNILVALLDKGFEEEVEYVEWRQIATIESCASI